MAISLLPISERNKRKRTCSRQRRFGKSMALNMLAAYYSRGCDFADLFRGLRIEQDASFREHLNRYDVIFLNMQQFLICAKGRDITEYLEEVVVEDLRESYGDFLNRQGLGLAEALEKIYAKTGNQFLFLIDEWDCVMRERQEAEDLQKQYLDFLQNLLKDQSYVALAYMTGILPVKKYGIQQQIKDRKYTQALAGYAGEILLVGIHGKMILKIKQLLW